MISRRGWIRTMDAWYHRSRWELPDDLLLEYRLECVERGLDLLNLQRRSPVTLEDPNGTAAFGYTRAQRRQHRKMARAGILLPHVLAEATARHAPVVNMRNGSLTLLPREVLGGAGVRGAEPASEVLTTLEPAATAAVTEAQSCTP